MSGQYSQQDPRQGPPSGADQRPSERQTGQQRSARRTPSPVADITGPFVRVGVAIAVMLAAAAVTTFVKPGGTSAARAGAETKPFAAPLRASTLVCPESRADESGVRTRVSALSAPASLPGGGEAGKLTVNRLDKATGLATVDKREKLARIDIKAPNNPPLVGQAEGALAPGATMGALTRSTEGPLRGLTEVPCLNPAAEFWFVGAGSQVGRHPVLYVTNAEDAEARVDVTLYDKGGRIDTDATRSLDVEPHSQLVIPLDKYAPTSAQLAVQVKAGRGRVAAALRDDHTIDGRAAGVDWIPASVAPARRLIVPGIAAGPGSRVLSVFNPGDTTAVVDLVMLGTNGSFEPAGHDSLEIEPGKVTQLDLADVTVEQPAALRIDADVPVVASMRNEVDGKAERDKSDDDGSDSSDKPEKPLRPVRDIAYTAASSPLTGPAVIPGTPSGKGRRARIQLSNPERSGTAADVVVLALDGRQILSEEVDVPGGGTAELGLPNAEGDKGYLVVVTPRQSGRLYGVRTLTEDVEDGPDPGPMLSIWPLASAPISAIRPAAHADLGAR